MSSIFALFSQKFRQYVQNPFPSHRSPSSGSPKTGRKPVEPPGSPLQIYRTSTPKAPPALERARPSAPAIRAPRLAVYLPRIPSAQSTAPPSSGPDPPQSGTRSRGKAFFKHTRKRENPAPIPPRRVLPIPGGWPRRRSPSAQGMCTAYIIALS